MLTMNCLLYKELGHDIWNDRQRKDSYLTWQNDIIMKFNPGQDWKAWQFVYRSDPIIFYAA